MKQRQTWWQFVTFNCHLLAGWLWACLINILKEVSTWNTIHLVSLNLSEKQYLQEITQELFRVHINTCKSCTAKDPTPYIKWPIVSEFGALIRPYLYIRWPLSSRAGALLTNPHLHWVALSFKSVFKHYKHLLPANNRPSLSCQAGFGCKTQPTFEVQVHKWHL